MTGQEIDVAILNYYADYQFQSQEDAYREFRDQKVDLERNTWARSQRLVRFEEIAALLVSAGHPETGPTALRRALAGVGVDAGNAGVLISGLEAAYEWLAQGPLD